MSTMEMKSKLSFDSIFVSVCNTLRLRLVAKYYVGHGWFQRFAKSIFTSVVLYWFLRAPLYYLAVDIMKVWYLLAIFAVGATINLVAFSLNELWIWKKRHE